MTKSNKNDKTKKNANKSESEKQRKADNKPQKVAKKTRKFESNPRNKSNTQQQHNRKSNRFPNQRKPDNTKNRQAQPRNEFRKYKKSGHPAYIYEKIGDEFIFLGITHNSVGEGTTKIRLEASPNPEDTKTTYMKKTPEIDKTNRFGSVKKGWKLSEKDKEKVKKIRSAPR